MDRRACGNDNVDTVMGGNSGKITSVNRYLQLNRVLGYFSDKNKHEILERG